VGEKEKEHEGVSKEGSPAAAREGAAEISAGGGPQGGRLGSNAAAALRCWAGDGERLRRRSAMSWSPWSCWLGAKVDGSIKSRAAAAWPAGALAAAQGREEAVAGAARARRTRHAAK
jgi:hypothetical protein